MSGKVAVKNIGAAKAGKSLLLLKCKSAQAGGCADHPALAAYANPAYPNYLTIKVPPLNPGKTYVHHLRFLKSLKWRVAFMQL